MSLLQKTIQRNGYSAASRCGHKIHHIIVHPHDTALELCARTAVMNMLFGLSLTSGTSVHGLERCPRTLSKQLPSMPLKSARRGVSASDLRKPSPTQKKNPKEHA